VCFSLLVRVFFITLASFNRRRRMKAESRQNPQKLAARLKFVCRLSCVCLDAERDIVFTALVHILTSYDS